jgi:hypothetical protein
MVALSLTETQALAELADTLYSFLPGSGAAITWGTVAARYGLERFWIGGSKLPAITQLLEAVFENERGSFCDLLLASIKEGMKYRIKKGSPVNREEIDTINVLVQRLHFKIPELHDQSFLKSLPAKTPAPASRPSGSSTAQEISKEAIQQFHRQFLDLLALTAQARGYALEKFLNDFFHAHGLAPRGSFRVVGEQIDGSFEWQGSTFLVEARWRAEPANASDLLVLRGKAEKSDWTRGLFISINGYSTLASDTFCIGRKANLIAMSGEDLILILENHWSLFDALRVKLRHTGETAQVYLPLSKATK